MQKTNKYSFILILLFGLVNVTGVVEAKEPTHNAACSILSQQSAGTSSAVYQPGIDAYGNAVASADIQPEKSIAGDVVNVTKVPLTIDLAERIRRFAGMGAEIPAKLGMLEIHPDGKVLYQGEDWTKSVKTLCGQSHKEVTVEVVQPEAPAAPQMAEHSIMQPSQPEAMGQLEMVKPLTNNLAVDERSARLMPDLMKKPKVFEPAEPIRPLVGTPKGKPVEAVENDIIKGQEFRDHNE